MKSIRIDLNDVHFTNKLKDDKLIVRTDYTENEELSKFWIDKGSMNLEITDSYQKIYYKNKVK